MFLSHSKNDHADACRYCGLALRYWKFEDCRALIERMLEMSSFAQINPVPGQSHSEGLDVSTAKTLTPPAGAGKLMIQALDQNVRITLDGTTPTADVGFQIKAGDPPSIVPVGYNMTIKVIEEAATADLQIQWLE